MGLSYVAPIGMQNLFVINTALHAKRVRAIFTALVVTFFDIALALACFLGVGSVIERFLLLQRLVLLIGGAIVCFIGFQLMRAKLEKVQEEEPVADSTLRTISMAFAVSWLNPQAIIDGTMMLAAFRVSLVPAGQIPFITGVMCASAVWFLGLTGCVSLMSKRITPKVLLWINRVCGCILFLYGAGLLLHFVREVLLLSI